MYSGCLVSPEDWWRASCCMPLYSWNCRMASTANRTRQKKPKKEAAPAVLLLVTHQSLAHEAASDEPIKKPTTATAHSTAWTAGWRKIHSSLSHRPSRWMIMLMRALIKAAQATKSKKPNLEAQLQLLHEITDEPQAPARSVKTNCAHFIFPIRVSVMNSGVNFMKPSPCSAIFEPFALVRVDEESMRKGVGK